MPGLPPLFKCAQDELIDIANTFHLSCACFSSLEVVPC